MEFNRFMQYAKYDLTINKAFYRNMSIVAVSIITGIAILGFLVRWTMVKNFGIGVDHDGSVFSYYSIGGTVVFTTGVVSLLMMMFSGCFNHPLRNKQGRISTLTLPATNGEKFLWHTLLVFVGGSLLCILSVIAADIVNALLSLITGFPTDNIYSITKQFFRVLAMNFRSESMGELGNAGMMFPIHNKYYYAFLGLVYASSIWTYTAFVFGNSVKYRYNIIWTILALWALQFVLSILEILGITLFFKEFEEFDFDPYNFENTGWTIYWIGMAIIVGTTVLMWWQSWRNYKNAQITNKLNRI